MQPSKPLSRRFVLQALSAVGVGSLAFQRTLAAQVAEKGALTAEMIQQAEWVADLALTDDERATFQRLNEAYVAKHGFPFIIAVRDNTKASILQAFQTRTLNDTQTEFATACAQVERIAELRLKDQLP